MGVYFLQAGDGGDVKVGQAKDIYTRLAQYRTHNSKVIHLLAWHPTWGYPEERALKKRLKPFRAEAMNEWHSPTPEVVAALDETLAAIASDPSALYAHLTAQDRVIYGACECCQEIAVFVDDEDAS